MELRDVIVGTRLNEIQKRPDDISLVFEDTRTNKVYILNFKGLLFETSGPTLNRKVKSIHLNNVLGFRATTQLRHLNRNPENYRQLYIQMEGSNDNNKLELLGALRNYKVVPSRSPAPSKKSSSKKSSVKKSTRKIGS
jgi:hypothetical protein